jgi:hypothetical protein
MQSCHYVNKTIDLLVGGRGRKEVSKKSKWKKSSEMFLHKTKYK